MFFEEYTTFLGAIWEVTGYRLPVSLKVSEFPEYININMHIQGICRKPVTGNR